MRIQTLVLVLATIFALAPAAPARAILLSLEPPTQTVNLAGTVSVDLNISGLSAGAAPSLGAWDVDIGFDPLVLTPSTVVFGPFLGDPSLFEAITGVDSSVAGIINLFEVSFLEADAVGCFFCIPPFLDDIQPAAFTVATLTFDAIGVGTSALTLSNVILGDALGDGLTADQVNGASVTVTAPVSVPEPGTYLLFVFGLAGIAALRRFALQG